MSHVLQKPSGSAWHCLFELLFLFYDLWELRLGLYILNPHSRGHKVLLNIGRAVFQFVKTYRAVNQRAFEKGLSHELARIYGLLFEPDIGTRLYRALEDHGLIEFEKRRRCIALD